MGKIIKIVIFAVVLVAMLVIGDLTPFTLEVYNITSSMAVPLRVLLRLIADAFTYTYINRLLLFYITLYLINTLVNFVFENTK